MNRGIPKKLRRRSTGTVFTLKAIPSEMIAAAFLKCGITLVHNSIENTDELDDSVIENLFEWDCESEFEGFIV